MRVKLQTSNLPIARSTVVPDTAATTATTAGIGVNQRNARESESPDRRLICASSCSIRRKSSSPSPVGPIQKQQRPCVEMRTTHVRRGNADAALSRKKGSRDPFSRRSSISGEYSVCCLCSCASRQSAAHSYDVLYEVPYLGSVLPRESSHSRAVDMQTLTMSASFYRQSTRACMPFILYLSCFKCVVCSRSTVVHVLWVLFSKHPLLLLYSSRPSRQ